MQPLTSIKVLIFFILFGVSTSSRITRASFVPPASPRVTDSMAPISTVASGYGLRSSDSCTLFAKKKPAVASPKKVQVKLLKHVAGTGQAGDVIMVTPAFFNNKLRPTKSAELITDEEVKAQELEAKAREDSLNAAANAVVESLDGFVLSIHRKSGPEGQLFGGIGPKCIMDELSVKMPSDLWSDKGVRITKLIDDEGNIMKGDIKHLGNFSATVSLTKDIIAKVAIDVVAES